LQIVPKHKFFLVYQFSNGKLFSMTRPFILYSILYKRSWPRFYLEYRSKSVLIRSCARMIRLIAYRTKDKQLGPKSSIMTSFWLSWAPTREH